MTGVEMELSQTHKITISDIRNKERRKQETRFFSERNRIGYVPDVCFPNKVRGVGLIESVVEVMRGDNVLLES